jgi:hypothetical protein
VKRQSGSNAKKLPVTLSRIVSILSFAFRRPSAFSRLARSTAAVYINSCCRRCSVRSVTTAHAADGVFESNALTDT